MRKIIRVFCALCCWVSVDAMATNYYVLGSFTDKKAAERRAQSLGDRLGAPIQWQTTEVNGIDRYRLLVVSAAYNEDVAESVSSIGIEPWRITLSEQPPMVMPSQIKPVVAESRQSSNQTALIKVQSTLRLLVGVFSDIDAALEMERRLADQGLPIRGAARLENAKVVHEVWVDPIQANDERMELLKSLSLPVLKREIIDSSDQDFNRSVRQSAQVDAQSLKYSQANGPMQQDSTLSKSQLQLPPAHDSNTQHEGNKVNQYPKDYNLARLKPKPEA